ncbi:MAG: carboxypeptidase-like regulatory domain-containing protein [Myxococcales bacterium]|nr:carboxypeptidase-like regulatory domain-containing protein [Myxococcales bacterium]
MRSATWMLLLGACSGTTTDPDTTDTDEPDVVETGTPSETGCEERVPSRACEAADPLTGTVTNAAGEPLPGAWIRFCKGETCFFGTADDAGDFCIEAAPAGWHAFAVSPPICSDGYTAAVTPVEFEDGQTRTLDMTLQEVGPATPLPATPEEIEVADGLFLTVGAGQLTADFEDPATEITGARVPEAEWPTLDIEGQVVDVWYVSPFEFKAEPKMPVRFANDRSLPDGTVLHVLNGSYKAQAWIDAGTVTAKGDWLEGGEDLGVTSTVVLVDRSK